MDPNNAIALADFAEQASVGLDALEAREWLRRIEEAHADLAAAFDWLIANRRVDDALRLAAALEKYWMMSGRLAEGRSWLGRAVTADGARDESRARGLFGLGMLAFWQGDDEASRAAHAESVQVARRVGALNVEALAITGLARISLRNGDVAEARALCQQALEVAAGTTESRGRSSAIHVLSVAAQMSGDLQEARDLMWQRLQLEREAGSLRLVAAESSNLSGVERQLGNLAEARELGLQALEIEEQQQDVWSIPYTFNQLAAIEAEAGNIPLATTLLGVASRMVDEQGAGWPPDEAPVFAQTRAACRRTLGDEAFQEAWSAAGAMSWQQAAASVRSGGSYTS